MNREKAGRGRLRTPARLAVWETALAERHLLIVKTGSTTEALAARRGDFEHWIADGLGLTDHQVRIVSPVGGEQLPCSSNGELAGVIISGSPQMVTDRPEWSVATGQWLAELVRTGTPVLGICYGHQLLVDALGGEVADNPRGPEYGTVTVRLGAGARNDPLLSGLGETLEVQVSHDQSVVQLPEKVDILAGNEHDPYHIIRTRRAYGVQFHPEFDAEITRTYVHRNADKLARLGHDVAQILAGIRETPGSSGLLGRFAAWAMSQPTG
jgi:GMP synthase (glutamine-hydrolysing)